MLELCLHKIGPEKSDQKIGPELQIAIWETIGESLFEVDIYVEFRCMKSRLYYPDPKDEG